MVGLEKKETKPGMGGGNRRGGNDRGDRGGDRGDRRGEVIVEVIIVEAEVETVDEENRFNNLS